MRNSTFLFSLFIILLACLFIYSCESERHWSNPHDPNTDLLPEDWRPINLIFLKNSSYKMILHWEYERENIGGFKLERKINDGSWEFGNALINKEWRQLSVLFETPLDSIDIDFRMVAYAGPNQSAYDTTIMSDDAVKIISVDYDTELMNISWEKYQLDDFDYYQILYSKEINGIKTIVDTILEIDSTSFSLDIFSPLNENWFWSRIVTKTGQGYLGEGRTNEIKIAPNPLDIISVDYDLDVMIVSWETSQSGSGKIIEKFPSSKRNNSTSDFESYELLHSLSETGEKTVVAVVEDENQTSYQVSEFDPTHANWFWLRVNDYWGLSSTGNGMTHDIDEPPTAVNIISIEYDILPLQMTILWESSQDLDFTSYKIKYSDTEMGVRTDIVTLSEINTNLFEIQEFDPTVERWYWLVTTDHWGQSTNSNGYLVYDEPPSQGMLYPIMYDNNSHFITWEQNQDEDFAKYILYESESSSMNDSTKIYSTDNRSDTTFTITGIDTVINRYYQLIYEDIWGSQTPTDIEAGIPYTRFLKTFGGEDEDVGYSVQQTSDGGYIVAGYTNSYGSGSYDVLLLKTDSDGNELWMQTFGEGYDDRGYSMQQTLDGGFVIAGYTYSFDSDSYDMFLVKTDSDGNQEWTKTYGGAGTDKGYSVQKTFDPDGFIITGYTETDSSGFDMFLVKTDSDGNQEWTKTYGGTGTDKGYSVQQTSDGGFIISGVTTAEYGFDIRMVKTNPNGEEEWNQVFGNTLNDIGFSVDQTDGGFVVVGYTEIFGSGDEDVLLVKLNADGSPDWEKTFGGNGIDRGHSVKTIDGGFMIIGFTESFGAENKDVWLIKTHADGSLDEEKTFGGNDIDHGYSVQLTDDDGFIITGYTKSEDNNVDILLIKDHPLGITQSDY